MDSLMESKIEDRQRFFFLLHRFVDDTKGSVNRKVLFFSFSLRSFKRSESEIHP